MGRDRAGDELVSALDPSDGESIHEAVENALAEAESEEAEYWIRTLLQRVVVELESPE